MRMGDGRHERRFSVSSLVSGLVRRRLGTRWPLVLLVSISILVSLSLPGARLMLGVQAAKQNEGLAQLAAALEPERPRQGLAPEPVKTKAWRTAVERLREEQGLVLAYDDVAPVVAARPLQPIPAAPIQVDTPREPIGMARPEAVIPQAATALGTGGTLPYLPGGRAFLPDLAWPSWLGTPGNPAGTRALAGNPSVSKMSSGGMRAKTGGLYDDLDLASDCAYLFGTVEEVDVNGVTVNAEGETEFFTPNGIPDLAELLLFQAILQDSALDFSAVGGITHADAVARWEWVQSAFALSDGAPPVDPRVERVVYAYCCLSDLPSLMVGVTLADTVFLELVDMNLVLNTINFEHPGGLLPGFGDADGDGYSNLSEWEEAQLEEFEGEQTFEDVAAAYVAMALDTQQYPAGVFYTMNRTCDMPITFPAPMAQRYRAGEEVTLAAVPILFLPYAFDHWEITPSGGAMITDYANPSSVTMNSDCDVRPVFAPDYDAEIWFEDIRLEQAVRVAVDKLQGTLVWSDVLGGQLTEMDAKELGITSLNGLEYCQELQVLNLRGNALTDISILALMPNLELLELGRNQITDLSALAHLTGLTGLELGAGDLMELDIFEPRPAGNPVTDLSPLQGLTNLEYLGLMNTPVTDLWPLAGLTALGTLYLDDVLATDFSPLANLTNLQVLSLGGLDLVDADLTLSANWPLLYVLNLSRNQLTHLDFLQNTPQLAMFAGMDNANLDDIGGFSYTPNLVLVLIANSSLADLSPLQNKTALEEIMLQDNQIVSLAPLTASNIADAVIMVRGNPLSQDSLCTYLPVIESHGNIVEYDGACGPTYWLHTAASPAAGGEVWPFLGARAVGAGTDVELCPEPNPDYVFSHWTDDVQTNTPCITVAMDSDKWVTAVFRAGDYTLTVLPPEGAAQLWPEVGGHAMAAGEWFCVSAEPSPGWAFVHWEDGNGAVLTTDRGYCFYADGDLTAVAVLQPADVRLNMYTDGEGTTEPSTEETHYYALNDTVPVMAWPGYHWVFDQWLGDVEFNTHGLTSVYLDDDKDVTAVFEYGDWELSVSQAGEGWVQPDPQWPAFYVNGATAYLSAWPVEGWFFEGWQGAVTTTDNNTSLVMDSDKWVQAVFTPAAATYEFTIVGEGNVQADDGQCWDHRCYFRDSTPTLLRAEPAQGWMFDHWEGALSGNDPYPDVVPSGARSATAVFVPIPATAIAFPDPNLHAAVCAAIGKGPAETVYMTDVVGMGFTYLHAADAGIVELTGLGYCRDLMTVNFSGNPIADIAPLGALPRLRSIDLSGVGTESIAALQPLNHVEELYLNDNSLVGIAEVAGFAKLRVLWFDGNSVSDLSPIAALTKLEQLSMVNCDLTDISSLSGLSNLVLLNLGSDAITGWSALSNLANLEDLTAFDCGLTGIEFLAPLPNLARLVVDFNVITDLTPLAGVTSLEHLSFGWNAISDLSPLASLPSLEYLSAPMQTVSLSNLTPLQSLVTLREVNLSNNVSIVDTTALSALTALEGLYLENNGVADIGALVSNTGLGSGDIVRLDGNALSEDARCIQIPALLSRGVDVTPANTCTYTLTLQKIGGGQIAGATSGSQYAPGTEVHLTTTSPACQYFVEWQGDASGSNPSITISMTESKHVVAVFDTYSYTLSLTKLGSGDVEVMGILGPLEPPYTTLCGRTLELEATADTGWQFVEWQGAVTGSQTTRSLVLSQDFAVTALFDRIVLVPDPNLEAAIRSTIGKPSGTLLEGDLLQLTSLTANYAGIADLTGLEYAANLTNLDLTENSLSSLTPLSQCASLESLYLSGNDVTDISPLSGLTSLLILNLAGNPINDLSPLQSLTQLEELYLADHTYGSIAPLSNLTNLRLLRLRNAGVSDVNALSGLALIDFLDLTANSIADLTPLSTLDSLRILVLNDNAITDITPLADLDNLEGLHFSNNQVSDVWTLANMASLQTAVFTFNAVSDVLPLVVNSNFRDGMLFVAGNPLDNDSRCIWLPLLEERNVFVDHVGTCIAYEVITSVQGTGSGNVYQFSSGAIESIPGGIRIAAGHSVTALAIPDTGSNFNHWEGAAIGAQDIVTLPVTGDASLAAVFDDATIPVVHPPDAGLESAVRNALGKPYGELLATEFNALTALDASDENISDLTGLELCTSLTALDLSNNAIADISLLAGLTTLVSLNLEGNLVVDLSPLANLTGLTSLRLSGNQIVNLASLGGLTGLHELYLDNNAITSITPLENLVLLEILGLGENSIEVITALDGMTSLEELYLNDNNVSALTALTPLTALHILDLQDNTVASISPLIANAGLAAGDLIDLGGNPLNNDAICLHVVTLQNRGATVNFEGKCVAYTLTVSTEGTGNGTIAVDSTGLLSTSRNSYEIALNHSATLTATPDANSRFNHWRGAVSSVNAVVSVPGTADYLVTGVFDDNDDAIVTIGDSALEAAIRSALNKPVGALVASELATITFLDITGLGVTSLSGLEYLTGLITLRASNNAITDVSPLGGLTALRRLNLSLNPGLSDISALTGCSALRYLNLTGTAVENISALDLCG